jgi:PleD family two-component response regulator
MEQSEFSRKCALVVDDGPVERLVGKSMLERLGFAVTTASTGEEAMSLLQERRVDLVLCDISMPGMGGLTLMEATREHPHPPPFIISTSHDATEHAVSSLHRGAYGYLTKPLHFEALRDTVAKVMARHEHEEDAARRAEVLAQQDALTCLMNKAEFCRRLTELLSSVPEKCEHGAILLIKIEGLSHINHTYGRAGEPAPYGDALPTDHQPRKRASQPL